MSFPRDRMDSNSNSFQHVYVSHKITANGLGEVLRDGIKVKISRVSDTEIRIGCTVVEIAALHCLLKLTVENQTLQEGAS